MILIVKLAKKVNPGLLVKFDYLDTVLTIKWHTGCVATPKQDCWNKDGKEVGCPPNNFGFSNHRMRLPPPFLNNFAFLCYHPLKDFARALALIVDYVKSCI